MVLYFIRHGQTIWNADNRIQGHLDIELSALGLHQAGCAARRMSKVNLSAVYSSDLLRASVTADKIAKSHGLTVQKSPLIREAMLGDFQGLTMKEAEAKFPAEYAAYRADAIANRPPGGETLDEVVARCRKFLDEVMALHKGENICVVGHGGSGRGLICAALDLPVRSVYGRIILDNAGLTIIDCEGRQPRLRTVNDTCHLHEEAYKESTQEF